MSEWVHCNNCVVRFTAGAPFFLTECGHTFCKRCAELMQPKNQCILCHKPGNILPLNKSVKQDVLDFFMPLESMLKKTLEVYKFQLQHRNSLINKLSKKYNIAKKEYLKLASINKRLVRENEMMRSSMLRQTQDRNFRFATSTPVSQMSEHNGTFRNVSFLSSIPPSRGTPSGNYPSFGMRNHTLNSASSKGPSPGHVVPLGLGNSHFGSISTMRSMEQLAGKPR